MRIRALRKWCSGSVRQRCIDNSFYTKGSNEAYTNMLANVTLWQPTYDNLYLIAKDIMEHSDQDGLTVESVMFSLERCCVLTFFSVDEED